MKILHVNCNYMGTKLHQIMIEHLNKKDIESTVYCPIYSGSVISTKPNDNVIVSNCFKYIDRFDFFRKQRKIYNDITSKVNVNDFDILHAYTLFTDGNIAYEINKRKGIPYCVAIRATDITFFKYRIFIRRKGINILKNASKIFFLSSITREKFIKMYVPKKYQKVFMEKSYIIPNGIDDFWFNNEFNIIKSDSQKIRLISVTQVIKRKNIPMIQKAVKLLKKDGYDVTLTVIGKNVNKKLTSEISNDVNTNYIPYIEKDKLINEYREANIFVLPSKGETFGLVYAEAMTQNLPIIYTKDEGFDGQFDDGEVGFAVNPNDYKDIANKILKIHNNIGKYTDNQIKAQKFNWDDICLKYKNIYEDILLNTKACQSNDYSQKNKTKIKMFFQLLLSIPKTIYFNFRFFPLNVAIKFPVLVSYNFKVVEMHKNIISFGKSPKLFMVKFGFGGSESINSNKGKLILEDGKVIFNGKATFAEGCCLRNSGNMTFGNNFFSNRNTVIWCDNAINIGENVLVGWNVLMRDSDGHYIIENKIVKKNNGKIILDNHVWIGANVSLLKNTSIPKNSVVGFGSIVSKKYFDENCIYAGIPAKKVKENISWERG